MKETETDLPGRFWSADSTGREVLGRIVKESPSLRLVTYGTVQEDEGFKRQVSDSGNVIISREFSNVETNRITIHGVLMSSGKEVSLVDCSPLGLPSTLPIDPEQEVSYRVGYIILGDLISGLDELYTGVEFQATHLDKWASAGGFHIERKKDGCALHYKASPPNEEILKSGARLSINQEAKGNSNKNTGGSIVGTSSVRVSSAPPSTWLQLDQMYIAPTVSLIQLSLGERSALTNVRVQSKNNKWLDYWSDSVYTSITNSNYTKEVATLKQLGLPNFGKWLNSVDELGSFPAAVASFVTAKSMQLETELLELTTVLEGLHGCLFPDSNRMSNDEAETVQSVVIEAMNASSIPDAHRECVRSMLTHLAQPGYRQCVCEIAKTVQLGDFPIGNLARWASYVTKIRNGYAHRSDRRLSEEQINQQSSILESLRWLLRAVLLHQAGLPVEYIADKYRAMSAYDLYRRRATAHLPRIFGQA